MRLILETLLSLLTWPPFHYHGFHQRFDHAIQLTSKIFHYVLIKIWKNWWLQISVHATTAAAGLALGCDFKSHFHEISKFCHTWPKKQHKMGLDMSNVSRPMYSFPSPFLWGDLVNTNPAAVVSCTVETLYNTINFCWSTHKRHSIARPKGRGMGCLLWVQRATYCVDLSILSSTKYLL